MPRDLKLPSKSKEGKELQCNYLKKKENRKTKKLITNPYQDPSINYSFQNRRILHYQQPAPSVPLVSRQYPQVNQAQQMIPLVRSQSRSTSNLLSRSNQYQHQSFGSNFSQNALQFVNNYPSPVPNSFCPPSNQSMINNQPQCPMNPTITTDLSQSLTSPPPNLSSGSQKPKRQKFTPDEDDIIINLVGDNKFPNWNEIATHIKGRTGRQCRERYQHYLSPNLSCEPWTLQEDRIVFRLYKLYGSKWALIAQYFNGRRTNNSIKNRWNNHIRFFKDSILNGDMKLPTISDNKRDFQDDDMAISFDDQILNGISSLDSKFEDFDLPQGSEQTSQQQTMTPLTTTPQTPEPHLPTFTFNYDNWNPFEQKGTLNNSSSGLLPTISIKDTANTELKLPNPKPEKADDKSNDHLLFSTEQNPVDFSTSVCDKPADKKEEDFLKSNRNDDEKSKSYEDQFINSENPNDPYYIDFDFLMF